jgi:hypothetical protein
MRDLFDDTPPHEIARTADPQTSKDAAQIAPTGRMRTFVLDMIKEAGKKGITIKEMTRANPDVQSSSITSRPNELEKMGLVFILGDKRDGSRIIRDKKWDNGFRVCGKCSGVLQEFYNHECQSPKCKVTP